MMSDYMLRLTEKANAAIRPMVPELKQFYQIIDGEKLGLIQLAIEIEKQFGERLYSEVCKTINISDGACLILAIGQLRPLTEAAMDDAAEVCHYHHRRYAQSSG
jgi:hypothetical protein